MADTRLGLSAEVVSQKDLDQSADIFSNRNIILPTFAQLADPSTIPQDVQKALEAVGPDEKHPLNLFRVHWYNGPDRKTRVDIPGYLVLPKELTGVDATILVAIGARFPMINAHKVLAAYGCLAPRIVTGQFNPDRHRAIWPSTGNYCRGGVALSRILGCRSSAVLPEGMSRERFEWLERWVSDPSDIVRTTGTESNVKEIYDACNVLSKDKENFLFNQFADFGNHLTHFHVTGPALHHIYRDFAEKCVSSGKKRPTLRAFTSATGSAGCIGAGDYLKEHAGTKTVAIEATECPTMLCNGFGEHNIQGIGDKHIPFIHNIVGSDLAVGVSDEVTDSLSILFNTEVGHRYLRERGVAAELVADLPLLGYSGVANTIGAIKAARFYGLGADDVIVTVATDSSSMYMSEFEGITKRRFVGGEFDAVRAAETYGRAILGASTADVLELGEAETRRVFNLGYYTWVEQQSVSIEDFSVRRQPEWWRGIRGLVPEWDALITAFNARTGVRVTAEATKARSKL